MRRVVIGLGSNLGDRAATIGAAVEQFRADPDVRVIATSALYETPPAGGPPQGDYMNAALLLETSDRFDQDRLTQEALLIAAKADIREELDRIASHIAQTREMIRKGGPVGPRLDFLAQEFHREVNTCCSKSNDVELTNTGLEMKTVVEQFREQVQNLE